MPIKECSLLTLREDRLGYWSEVFKLEYATPTIFSEGVSKDPFTIQDVEEVIASVDGANDESNWVMVGQLKDGRFFKIAAGCDYTGWG